MNPSSQIATQNVPPPPSGCFTADSSGRIIASTLPGSFSPETAGKIAEAIIATFRHGQQAQMTLGELQIQYAACKLSARELRGGAIVFLAPASPN